MNRLKRVLFPLFFFCVSLAGARAQLYRYDFIVTATGTLSYPLSAYAGISLDLTAPSGNDVSYGSAIAGWNFPNGQGTITPANSSEFSYGGPAVMSWDSSTITSFGNVLGFASGGTTAYPWPGNTAVTVSYYVGNNNFSSESLFGYWQAETVPEPAAVWLCLAMLTGWFVVRRGAGRSSRCHRMIA